MKPPTIPDYSGQPCKSIIAENINAVKKGKELTAPLSYLNKSCEFKTAYVRIIGDITHFCDKKAYRQSDKGKASQKKYQQSDKFKASQKKYQQSDKFKASQKKYQQSDKCKASKKAYLLRKKGEKK